MNVSFEEWLREITPKVVAAQTMLRDSLSRDHSELSNQAGISEDAYRKMNDILSEANCWLDDLEYSELMAMDRESGTASERKIILNYKLKDRRMLRDKVKGLVESLRARMRRAQWQA